MEPKSCGQHATRLVVSLPSHLPRPPVPSSSSRVSPPIPQVPGATPNPSIESPALSVLHVGFLFTFFRSSTTPHLRDECRRSPPLAKPCKVAICCEETGVSAGIMDGEEFDITNNEVFSNHDATAGDQFQSSCSMDSFFDEILKDTHACTHTHTCNPPGPDLTHTHTCFHVHTKILPVPVDESAESTEKSPKKAPCGNREAVRKYREKKKAQAASLEDENRQLREQNQQLLKKLQSLATVEAENMRLKCLLVDLRGRIDGEIGPFPYMKSNSAQMNMGGGGHSMNSCGLRFDEHMYCMVPGMQGGSAVEDGGFDEQRVGISDFGSAPCLGSSVAKSKDVVDYARGNGLSGGCIATASAKRRKGAKSPTTEC